MDSRVGLGIAPMAWFVCLALLTVVAYSLAGYAALMALLSRFKPKPLTASEAVVQGVSVVLCARNAASRITARLDNLRESDWGGEMEICVYDDASGDGTAQKLADYAEVKWVREETPQGKAHGLNVLIPQCKHEVVVLCDVRQRFAPDAIRLLAECFQDPGVAAVSGQLLIEPSASGGGQGVDLYWKLERKLREWEGAVDSVIGCTGAIYAIRREWYERLPEDTLLDDVVIPMRMSMAGGRVYYEPKALAHDPQILDPASERGRKLRTLVGNYQMMERYPQWMNPVHSRLWWQVVSHKYLRLLVPWLLLAVAVISIGAFEMPGMRSLVTVQLFCYGAAALGLLLPQIRWRVITIPAGFVLLQWSCVKAFFAYVLHRRDLRVLWPSPAKGGAR